jgi:hypothetical protein
VSWPPTESTASRIVSLPPVVASFTVMVSSALIAVTTCELASALVGM